MCIVCGETGHWGNTCANTHPNFKATKAKREAATAAASKTNERQLIDDLRNQTMIKHYKALSEANSAASSKAESDSEKEEDVISEDCDGVAAMAVNRKRRFPRCLFCQTSSLLLHKLHTCSFIPFCNFTII